MVKKVRKTLLISWCLIFIEDLVFKNFDEYTGVFNERQYNENNCMSGYLSLLCARFLHLKGIVMNISKKIVALVCAAQVVSAGALVAKLEQVVIDSTVLLQESKRGQELRKQLEAEASVLREEQQKLVAELQQKEQKFKKESRAFNKDMQERELAKLRKEASKIEGTLREMTSEFEAKAREEQERLHMANLDIAGAMVEEKNWGVMFERRALIGANKKLDVTQEVLARLDEKYEQEIAQKSVLVAQASEIADSVVTA